MGHPGAFLAIQDDGNVVVYDRSRKPLWATATAESVKPPRPRGEPQSNIYRLASDRAV
jgi:hypothetical protein